MPDMLGMAHEWTQIQIRNYETQKYLLINLAIGKDGLTRSACALLDFLAGSD